MDGFDDFMMTTVPTTARPLLGTTFLLVEDSRFAAEGFRLLCLRSGGRIRRADSLTSARKHLKVYRPNVVLVDMTLPDGSGAELIRDLDQQTARPDAIIAVSGDDTMEQAALQAGADRFLLKPLRRLAEFQAAILQLLPKEKRPVGPRAIVDTEVEPDAMAYRDDLFHAADSIDHVASREDLAYVSQFLSGVAESAGDRTLADAARTLPDDVPSAAEASAALGNLSKMVKLRINASDAF